MDTFNNLTGQSKNIYHKREDEMKIAESIYVQSFLRNQQQGSSDIFQKVEEKVKSINPHLKGIVKEDLMLSSCCTLTKNVVNQKSEIVKKLEQESQYYMDQKILNIQQKNQPLNKLNSQDQKDILKAALFQYFRQEGCQVQITSNINNDQTYANSYQSQLVLTGQTDKLKYLQVGINDQFYTYQKIVSDDVTKKEVISKFLKATSNQYGVSKDRITILDIQQGCQSMVNFIFSIKGLKTDQIFKTAIDQYQIEFPKAQISAMAKSLIDNYQISDEYLDERFNMYWGDSYSTQIDYRGSLPRQGYGSVPQRYYFPVGFQGYGINVQKWLAVDQSWFGQSKDKNVWIVLYHATNENGLKGISSSYIKPGLNNAYGGTQCRLTNKTILSGAGANTYFSDRASGPNSSEGYGGKIQLGNKNYIIMFQCRVNPIHVRSPYNMESYYTVEQEYAKQSVRPYRILLKEV
ncbi:kinase domain protein (macronuclear) [Tetrahymena thermophila SB210]|uniref:Kinase domain protein n=1 Tax=Tetrahymena thermophila (strain SB210) TaxID=312017 RepID=Q22T75_TETTS|nr:kinase domain protein [Tetrahymena thermophila SB210]EAR88563.2 kinase domain protein [Tetrahymena thermophila SB210]|eukprot:XP_001008808.2 kinase domain protein [Tetrahymena thermophila SB210]